MQHSELHVFVDLLHATREILFVISPGDHLHTDFGLFTRRLYGIGHTDEGLLKSLKNEDEVAEGLQ